MSDLFAAAQPRAPLADALRPQSLDDVAGQQHLIGPGKPLRLAFESGKPHSMILWGPPGSGKTTIARLMAKAFDLSDAGAKDGLEWLEARPREREAGFERVRMGFDAENLRAMELLDHFGQTTRLQFSNLRRNPKVDKSEFRFEPPKGADVLGEK